MGELLAREVFSAEHGALTMRDPRSVDDLSTWEPKEAIAHWMASAAIFGVQPSIEGDVELTVWRGVPDSLFGEVLGAHVLALPSGVLIVEDPNQTTVLTVEGLPDPSTVELRADDREYASRVQVIVTG